MLSSSLWDHLCITPLVCRRHSYLGITHPSGSCNHSTFSLTYISEPWGKGLNKVAHTGLSTSMSLILSTLSSVNPVLITIYYYKNQQTENNNTRLVVLNSYALPCIIADNLSKKMLLLWSKCQGVSVLIFLYTLFTTSLTDIALLKPDLKDDIL